jgi:hypothetical protein
MDRRSRRFVPRLEGSLEDRVVLSAGPAHAHIQHLTGGTIPVLSRSTYQSVVYEIQLAFRSYRGDSQIGSQLGSIWHSLTHGRWTWPDGNKPNDVNALRTRVFSAVSHIPYATRQLVPTLDNELNPASVTQQNSRTAQNLVLRSLQQFVTSSAKSELFLLGR